MKRIKYHRGVSVTMTIVKSHKPQSPKTGDECGSTSVWFLHPLPQENRETNAVWGLQTHLRLMRFRLLAWCWGDTYSRRLDRESISSWRVMAMGSKPFASPLGPSCRPERSSSAKGAVCSRHWRTEFMKHVFPRLNRPEPCAEEMESQRKWGQHIYFQNVALKELC